MSEHPGTPEAFSQPKGKERLQAQAEAAGFAFQQEDLQLPETALKQRYGEQYDLYVAKLRNNKKKELQTHKRVYESAYKNKDNAPTWLTVQAERRALVELAAERLKPPVRALDIGCGTGETTSWIGDTEGNYWVGVDTVDQATLGVRTPKHGEFLQGNFADEAFVNKHESLQSLFDLVIDHGAIATSLQKENDLIEYLGHVEKKLKRDGIFAVLVSCNPEGAAYNEALPDGRLRRFFSPSDFTKPPFANLFSVEDTRVITYAADSPSNPYSKLPDNQRPISVAQALLRKK